MTYYIYEDYIEEVEKKLNRIAKKCKQHGNDFVYKRIGEEVKEIKNEDGTFRYNFILIEVEGTAKIEDWEFVAVIEVHNEGNIIRKYNTEIDVPERFFYTKNVCEHCNSNRFRNNLYIIHNVKTNEWKQVGKNCLALYTHGLNAEYVASYMNGITELETKDCYVGVHGKPLFDIYDILSYATEIIDKIGYFNSSSDLPTKILVADMVTSTLSDGIISINKMLMSYNINFSKSDFHKENTSKKVDDIISYYENLKDNSDFIRNVQMMIKARYVALRNIGYLCYMPEGYNRFVQHEEEKKKQLAEEINEHFGEVGKRYKNVKVRNVKILRVFENVYGFTYFSKIVLEDGHVLFWSGKGFLQEMYSDKDRKYIACIPDTISFTIKEHSEYNNIPQTIITRCTVTYKYKDIEN